MNTIKIHIGGKERIFRFGLKVIGDCIKHEKQGPSEFMSSLTTNPFDSIPTLFYYASKYELERNGEPVDFTRLQVCEWIEEKGIEDETIDNVVKVFLKSMYDNVPLFKQALDKKENKELKKTLLGIGIEMS